PRAKTRPENLGRAVLITRPTISLRFRAGQSTAVAAARVGKPAPARALWTSTPVSLAALERFNIHGSRTVVRVPLWPSAPRTGPANALTIPGKRYFAARQSFRGKQNDCYQKVCRGGDHRRECWSSSWRHHGAGHRRSA